MTEMPFGPHSEGFWCATCGVHWTMSSIGLCPSCADDRKRDVAAEAERKKREAAA
jgi:hypothetical protein